jgi:hypothetical protein
MNMPHRTKPSVNEGRKRYFNETPNLNKLPSSRLSTVYKPVWKCKPPALNPVGSNAGEILPPVGSQCSHTPKIIWNIMPKKKTGIA